MSLSPLNDLYLWSCKYTSKKIISRTNEISIERKTTFHFFHSFLLHQLVTMNYWFFYWLLFESASLWWCWQSNKLHSLVGLLHKLLLYFFIITFRQLYVNNLHFFFFWMRKEITCFIKNYLRSHTIDIDVHNDRQ